MFKLASIETLIDFILSKFSYLMGFLDTDSLYNGKVGNLETCLMGILI
jgi:hypothetical protein